MPIDWSETEVEAVVADYFSMLEKELRDETYNKTEHRRHLSRLLHDRSDGSIERKHQNISAILIEIGYPYISGYKPLSNFQGLLAEVVISRAATDENLLQEVQKSALAPTTLTPLTDILQREVDRPDSRDQNYFSIREPERNISQRRAVVNYLEKEAQNSSLGRAGELLAIQFERARLIALNKAYLADRVEHLPSSGGDGAGFDIRSFEPDGSDRLIEVKTTAYGKLTPVFLSANELRISRWNEDRYHLYRIFHFRRDPRMFMLKGSLDHVLRLEPTQFKGHVQ